MLSYKYIYICTIVPENYKINEIISIENNTFPDDIQVL